MKVIHLVALFVTTTLCVAVAEKNIKAHFYKYDYDAKTHQKIPEKPQTTSDTKTVETKGPKNVKAHFYEYDYNGETAEKSSTETPQTTDAYQTSEQNWGKDQTTQSSNSAVSDDTLEERFSEISINADGVEIFMDALDQVMMGEETVVKIPAEIDPEQHIISLEDAFDRMEEFLTEQMEETQNFLSEINDAIDEKKMSKSSTTLYRLQKVKDELMNIIETFTDSGEDLRNYRQSQSLDEVYSSYYGGNENEEDEGIDEQDVTEISGNPPVDAEIQFGSTEALFIIQEKVEEVVLVTTKSEYLEPENDYTESNIYEKNYVKDDREYSTKTYISIGIGITGFCVCLILLISLLYRRTVRNRMSKPAYKTRPSSGITVVPIYGNEISHSHPPPPPNQLPGYLQVISGSIYNPSEVSSVHDKKSRDKLALIP